MFNFKELLEKKIKEDRKVKYLIPKNVQTTNEIIEIESICSLCGEQSVVNARYNGEHIIVDGSQIEIGGNDKYKPLCYKCYLKEIYRERGKISEII